MRHSVLAMLCLALFAQTTQSQLTLTPKLGIENSRTMVRINENNFIKPVSLQLTPQAGIRLDYKFKSGHGVFAGVSTSNTTVSFSFTDPETSISNYFASRSSTQLRLEGGYQFNSKPVFFKNAGSSKKKTEAKSLSRTESSMKRGCGSYSSHSCCDKLKAEKSKSRQGGKKAKPMSVRFQPQLGMAYIPSTKPDFTAKQTSYTYNAGNWDAALITGMGFEFAKGKTKLFQINLQYLKGIGNMSTAKLQTEAAGKSVETSYSSRASSWSLSFGVPVSFAKNSATKKQKSERSCQQQRSHCEQKTQYRCRVRI
jgi:hypothetical protein